MKNYFYNKILEIREASSADVNLIVEQHLISLNFGVYAKIGKDFLKRYYLQTISNENNHLLVAVYKTKIIGIVELRNSSNLNEILKFNDFLKIFFICLKDIRYFYLLIRRIFFAKKFNSKFIELSNFVVEKKYRSKGCGTKLLIESLKICNKKKLKLFTYTHNSNLANFYKEKFNAKISLPENLLVYKSYLCLFE